jgi:hypothetical protein
MERKLPTVVAPRSNLFRAKLLPNRCIDCIVEYSLDRVHCYASRRVKVFVFKHKQNFASFRFAFLRCRH